MRQLARTLCRALSQSSSLLPELNVGGATSRHFTTASGHCAPTHIQDEPYCRQRQMLVLGNRVPQVSPDVWVAPNALLIGDVDLFDMVYIPLLIFPHFGNSALARLARFQMGGCIDVKFRTLANTTATSSSFSSSCSSSSSSCSPPPARPSHPFLLLVLCILLLFSFFRLTLVNDSVVVFRNSLVYVFVRFPSSSSRVF